MVNKNILFIVDYYSKFPVVKKVVSLLAGDLVHTTRMIFAEFGLPRKIISNVETKFTSETFKAFCKKLNIQQSITLSYHHQNNGQGETYIKFVKHN